MRANGEDFEWAGGAGAPRLGITNLARGREVHGGDQNGASAVKKGIVMKNLRIVRLLAASGLLGAALSAGEAMAPEVTHLPDTGKLLVGIVADGPGPSLLVRALEGDGQRVARQLPAEGLSEYKLGLIAQTAKDGVIAGYSLVTWKPAEKGAEGAAREWPQLKDVAGATARIRGAQTLMLRRFAAAEGKDAKWSLEILSFRKMEPKEDEEAILRAKKEIVEDGGVRLVEQARFTLVAPSAPTEANCYGIVLVPVWKEEGRILDGFDAQLVTTPAPAATEGQ